MAALSYDKIWLQRVNLGSEMGSAILNHFIGRTRVHSAGVLDTLDGIRQGELMGMPPRIDLIDQTLHDLGHAAHVWIRARLGSDTKVALRVFERQLLGGVMTPTAFHRDEKDSRSIAPDDRAAVFRPNIRPGPRMKPYSAISAMARAVNKIGTTKIVSDGDWHTAKLLVKHACCESRRGLKIVCPHLMVLSARPKTRASRPSAFSTRNAELKPVIIGSHLPERD